MTCTTASSLFKGLDLAYFLGDTFFKSSQMPLWAAINKSRKAIQSAAPTDHIRWVQGDLSSSIQENVDSETIQHSLECCLMNPRMNQSGSPGEEYGQRLLWAPWAHFAPLWGISFWELLNKFTARMSWAQAQHEPCQELAMYQILAQGKKTWDQG